MKIIKVIILLFLFNSCIVQSDNKSTYITYTNGSKKYTTVQKKHTKNSYTEFGLLCQDSLATKCSVKLMKKKKSWFIYNSNGWVMFYDNQTDSIINIDLIDAQLALKYIGKNSINDKSVSVIRFALIQGGFSSHNPFYFFDNEYGIVAFGYGNSIETNAPVLRSLPQEVNKCYS